jgi:hypothetical protein
MANLLEQAINCNDGDRAAKIIMDALGIKTEELANYCLKNWPTDRKQRARIISNWLQEEAYSWLNSARSPLQPLLDFGARTQRRKRDAMSERRLAAVVSQGRRVFVVGYC